MAGSAKSSKTKNHLTNTQGLSTTSIFDDVLEKQQTIRRISFLFDKCQHYTFCTSGILFHGFCNIRRNYAKWILYDVQSKRWVEYIFIWQYYVRNIKFTPLQKQNNPVIRMLYSRPYSTFQLNSDIGSSPTIFNYKTKGARSGIYSSTGQQYIPS